MITYEQYITASGKYPERLTHPELTEELKTNAIQLLSKVNAFLIELGLTNVSVSSGFRPTEVNAATKGSAKASLHCQCRAIDLGDVDGKIDALITSRDDLKKKYMLWQESPMNTKGWAHLDNKDRGVRKENTFIP